jgi:hypothetical protein
MTNVMIGRMYRSGARDDRNEPISTAGTLPITIDAVTPNWTVPNTSAPSAAAAVSGTACVRSVPTSCPALSSGYRNSSRTIIRDPEPTDVMPTMTPPMMPISTVGMGRTVILCTVPVRWLPDRRSRMYRNTMAAAPTSRAAPSATSTCFCCAELPPSRCRK